MRQCCPQTNTFICKRHQYKLNGGGHQNHLNWIAILIMDYKTGKMQQTNIKKPTHPHEAITCYKIFLFRTYNQIACHWHSVWKQNFDIQTTETTLQYLSSFHKHGWKQNGLACSFDPSNTCSTAEFTNNNHQRNLVVKVRSDWNDLYTKALHREQHHT